MSYATLEEAYVPLHRFNDGASGKKSRRDKKFTVPLPEPKVIEPDRPAARPPTDVELLGGPVPENRRTTSQSNMLIGMSEGDDEYYPFTNGADIDVKEDIFMMKPDWTKQLVQARSSETPVSPPTPVDGYSTLWQQIPDPKNAIVRNPRETAGIGLDDELRNKIDKILAKMESHDDFKDSRDNNSELLVFIFAGLGIVLLLDFFFRSQQSTLVRALTASFGQTGGGRGGRSYSRYLKQLRIAGLI